jgi:hypothetical protein
VPLANPRDESCGGTHRRPQRGEIFQAKLVGTVVTEGERTARIGRGQARVPILLRWDWLEFGLSRQVIRVSYDPLGGSLPIQQPTLLCGTLLGVTCQPPTRRVSAALLRCSPAAPSDRTLRLGLAGPGVLDQLRDQVPRPGTIKRSHAGLRSPKRVGGTPFRSLNNQPPSTLRHRPLAPWRS